MADVLIDTLANVPASISVVYPRADSGGFFGTDSYAVVVTLASLSLANYDDEYGHTNGTHLVQVGAVAEFEGGADPVNVAELTAMARQIATDWYEWKLASLELRLNSFITLAPDCMHDHEWLNESGQTIIHRSEWEPGFGEVAAASSYGSTFIDIDIDITDIVVIINNFNITNTTINITVNLTASFYLYQNVEITNGTYILYGYVKVIVDASTLTIKVTKIVKGNPGDLVTNAVLKKCCLVTYIPWQLTINPFGSYPLNSVTPVVTTGITPSGSPVLAGFGSGIVNNLPSSNGTDHEASRLDTKWVTPTEGTQKARLTVSVGGVAVKPIAHFDNNGSDPPSTTLNGPLKVKPEGGDGDEELFTVDDLGKFTAKQRPALRDQVNPGFRTGLGEDTSGGMDAGGGWDTGIEIPDDANFTKKVRMERARWDGPPADHHPELQRSIGADGGGGGDYGMYPFENVSFIGGGGGWTGPTLQNPVPVQRTQPVNGVDMHNAIRKTDTGPTGSWLKLRKADNTVIRDMGVNGEDTITLPANGLNAGIIQRNTDTSPTGTFYKTRDAAANTIYQVDIAGVLAWGSGASSTARSSSQDNLTPVSSSLTAASTLDLATSTGRNVPVAGSTGITALGTVQAGAERVLEFASTPTITHNGTSLILPNGVSITAAAGDQMGVESLGSGNWRCQWYTRAANPVITVADSGTVTFDCSLGDTTRPCAKFRVTMGGNRTLAVTNFVDGTVLYIELIQDGTGSRIPSWFANILWGGGSAPTLTTTASKRDVFIFIYDGTSAKWADGGYRLNL